MQPRIHTVDTSSGKRFLADSMLAKLARWLRLLGIDCAYEGGSADAELVRSAVRANRVILTRDGTLENEWWVPNIHVLRTEKLRDQLLEVVRRFDLAGAIAVLSRCNECNEPVRPVAANDVRDRVPPHVWERHGDFSVCPRCGRVFWEGTHAERIRRVAEELLAEL